MAFTRALYYPWIDIRDEAWLKNAMLYWEEIQTIVPSSIGQPYETRTAQEFYEEGVLSPLYVEPGMSNIDELTNDVLKYIESPEGADVLISEEISESRFIHPDKLSEEISEILIHKEKLPYQIEHIIRAMEQDRSYGSRSRSNWIRVNPQFANFYMTLLATSLAKTSGSGLLTDTAANNRLSTAVKLDARLQIPTDRRFRSGYINQLDWPRYLAQGILADLIIEKIQIDPKTPVRKILKFRRDHADELGRFRTKIDELTSTLSSDQPIEALRQSVSDIYINEVSPEISSLERGLTESKIRWFTENFIKISFFSTSPFALLGLSIPYALLVGAGISLTASAVLYNIDKADDLRHNPFSYLLAVEKEFHRRDEIEIFW